MTQLLLQNGATLTVEDASALLNKAIINQNVPMAQLLVQNGATLTMKDVSARLDEAIKNENAQMAQVLKLLNFFNINHLGGTLCQQLKTSIHQLPSLKIGPASDTNQKGVANRLQSTNHRHQEKEAESLFNMQIRRK